MIGNRARVLIVEDSILYQTYLRAIIEKDEQCEVVGVAGNGREAMALASHVEADVITLDLCLPDIESFELLKWFVNRKNTPVIVITSLPGACKEAIEIGARDFITKVDGDEKYTSENFATLLRIKIKSLTGVSAVMPVKRHLNRVERASSFRDSIIVIGASIGGTEATLKILRQLPDTLPGIVIVQHMQIGFTSAYAMHLDKLCQITVKEAVSGDVVAPGTALIAKSGEQLLVRRSANGYAVVGGGNEKVSGFCPSVDVLFRSAAQAASYNAVGIILTGMGRDGALGMKAMHDNGAYTISQDEHSCVVYGMPLAAYELGAVDDVLSPNEIAQRLIDRFSV